MMVSKKAFMQLWLAKTILLKDFGIRAYVDPEVKCLQKRTHMGLNENIEGLLNVSDDCAHEPDVELDDADFNKQKILGITHGKSKTCITERASSSTEINHSLARKQKVAIQDNLAKHIDQIASMKTKYIQLKAWFELLAQNEDMLAQYGEAAVGTSIPTILQEMKEICQDIKEQIQIRLRRWGGLGGRTLELESGKEIGNWSPALVEKRTDDHEIYSKAQGERRMQSGNPENQIGRPNKAQRVTEKHSPKKIPDHTESSLDDLEESKPHLHESLVVRIYDKLMETRAQDLRKILHSVTFLFHGEEGWEIHWERIRAIKLCFEKFVFKAIQFMFKFDFIQKVHLQRFFSAPGTLSLTGTHIVDLFDIAKYRVYKPLDFCPAIDFVCNQLQAEHLHESLEALDEKHQARVMYAALSAQVKIYEKRNGNKFRTYEQGMLYHFFCDNNFLIKLEKSPEGVSQSDVNTHYATDQLSLEQFFRKVLGIFQNPIPTPGLRPLLEVFMSEYILNYHILNFLKTYYNQHLMGTLITTSERQVFDKQTKLYKLAFEMGQAIKQALNYMVMPYSPHEQVKFQYRKIAIKEYRRFLEDFRQASDCFKRELCELSEMTSQDSKLQEWLQGDNISKEMLRLFSHEAESWKNAIGSERLRRERSNDKYKLKESMFTIPRLKKPFLLELFNPNAFYV